MNPEDGATIAALVRECGVLDPNSTYAYVLLGDRFGEHGVVADDAGTVVGFVSGFRDPRDPRVLFLWQVGVAARARGQGLATKLLDAFVDREANRTAEALETTIATGNAPSEALFRAFAKTRGASFEPISAYPSTWLDGHPAERVIRIAPLSPTPRGDTSAEA
jgi:L-2,4-diaminobutyric acid acetyltransferase